ncbi:MAG: SURF1 family cytochrome oxidase biogenesis protein [Corynebacterium sp.]|nr:SURF1 family cytochrome oxidase biogenesis protein [Corynebacterium sp.]
MRRATIPLIILATLIAIIAALAWYFKRDTKEEIQQRQPVTYTQGLDEWQPVTITGTYMPQHIILINTPNNTQHLVTGFSIPNGPKILVDRGEVRKQNLEPPTEPITITGYIRHSQPGMGPILEKYPPETDRINTKVIGEALGEVFEEDYVELKNGQPSAAAP